MLLEILDVQQTGWHMLAPSPVSNPTWDKNWKHDVRCRPISEGTMVVQIVTAPGMPRPLQVLVFRSSDASCPSD
jgi:hypothetical protein